MRPRSRLGPLAAMRQRVAPWNPAHQKDRFRQHQLRHAARIGKRRIENRHALLLRRRQIHLVGPDTETSHPHQLLRLLENLRRQLRRRTDPDEGCLAHRRHQLLLRQRLRMILDIAISVLAESFHRARIDAFEQQNMNFVLSREFVFTNFIATCTKQSRAEPRKSASGTPRGISTALVCSDARYFGHPDLRHRDPPGQASCPSRQPDRPRRSERSRFQRGGIRRSCPIL